MECRACMAEADAIYEARKQNPRRVWAVKDFPAAKQRAASQSALLRSTKCIIDRNKCDGFP